jgi:cytochrome c2
VVSGNSGGTINFTGATQTLNTGASAGVSLTSNTGTTINFNPTSGGNGLDIATTTGTGFNASGGGTVSVSVNGTGNTINSPNATALNVANTTIGASGLTFQSISSGNNDAGADPVNGIVLNNTGTSGGLHVTGNNTTARDGSGGTIQHTTGDGISLTSTQGVQLAHMNINNTGGNGVFGTSVNGFVSDWNSFSTNGDAAAEGSIRFGSPTDGTLNGLTGGAVGSATETRIDHTLLSGSFENNISIYNSSGTLSNLSMTGTTSQNSAHGSGMLIEVRGTSTATVNIVASTFSNNFAEGFLGQGLGSANLTVNALGAGAGNTNTFTGGTGGFFVSNQDNAHVTTEVSNNTFSGQANNAIFIGQATPSATSSSLLTAKVLNNTITSASAAVNENHIVEFFFSGTNAPSHVTVSGNNVTNNGNFDGINVNTPDAGSSPHFEVKVVNNTITSAATAVNGIGLNARQSSTAVFKVEGNTSTSGHDVRVREVSPATASLETGTSSGTAAAVLAANNPGAPTTSVSGTVTVVANGTGSYPLLVQAGGIDAASTGQDTTGVENHLTQSELNSVIQSAIDHWAATGLSATQIAVLQQVTYDVADITPGWLGASTSGHVAISTDAAGYGWFIDPTPADNAEFAHAASATHLTTDPTEAPAGHMDLLTTVMHEMGEQLGMEDSYAAADRDALRYAYLTTGERRLPSAADAANSVLSLTAAQYQALGAATFAASNTVTLADTGAHIAALTAAEFAALAGHGIDRIDASDNALGLTVAQYQALGGVTLADNDVVTFTDVGATLMEAKGSTLLTRTGAHFFLYDTTLAGPSLKYAGADVFVGEFGPAWSPIAAEQTSGGYVIAWKVGASQYSVWNTDSNGNFTTNPIGIVSGTNLALETLESSFHQDLNGDGQIGPPTTVIEANGSTQLTEVGATFFLYDNGGSGPSLKYGGRDYVAGQFGIWDPIAAEQTASGYEVAWKVGANQYSVWNTDSSGNFTTNPIGIVSGTSMALETLETSFHQDLNGDGQIGPPTTVIEANGSTKLTEVGTTFFLYDGAGSGPELKYAGAPFVADASLAPTGRRSPRRRRRAGTRSPGRSVPISIRSGTPTAAATSPQIRSVSFRGPTLRSNRLRPVSSRTSTATGRSAPLRRWPRQMDRPADRRGGDGRRLRGRLEGRRQSVFGLEHRQQRQLHLKSDRHCARNQHGAGNA